MKITTGGLEYDFGSDVTNVTDDMSQGITKLSFPEQEPDEGMFMRFSGQSREISFDFNLRDDGTDRANGTHTSTVTTPIEQRDYLYGQIFSASADASWTLQDDKYYPSGKAVAIKSINITKSGDEPLEFKAKIEFIVSSNVL